MKNNEFDEQMRKYEKKNEELQKELILTRFVTKLKQDLFVKCTTIQSVDDDFNFDMNSEEVNTQIDKTLKEFLGK